MNTKILQKVLEELQKNKPRLDYVRGMIESLVDMDDKPLNISHTSGPVATPNFYERSSTTVVAPADEIVLTQEEIDYARKMAGGPVGNIS
jgi:hypothetical protein